MFLLSNIKIVILINIILIMIISSKSEALRKLNASDKSLSGIKKSKNNSWGKISQVLLS